MKISPYLKPAFLSLALLALGACKKHDSDSAADPNATTPETFNYKTTNNVDLTVKAISGSVKMTGADVVLLKSRPSYVKDQNGVALYPDRSTFDTLSHGAIDDDGQYQTSFQIPTSLDTVYAYSSYTGLQSITPIAVGHGGTISTSLVPGMANGGRYSSGRLAGGTDASLPSGYQTFGGWDQDGVPLYLGNDKPVTNALLTNVTNTLPEGVAIFANRGDIKDRSYLIDQTAQTEVKLVRKSNVSVTFIHEGAGYRNALGYFTYNTANANTLKLSDIKNTRKLIFPNVSYPGSGGNLHSGNTVNLGQFDAGQTVGWFISADGFKNEANNKTRVDSSSWRHYYSHRNFNPETKIGTDGLPLNAHMVFLKDLSDGTKKLVIGFEDLQRESAGCDHDFNDVIFYVTVEAVDGSGEGSDDSGIKEVIKPQDSDNDGVADISDDFPNDPERCYNNFTPAKNVFGTLCFEDLWPGAGDYDMNDLVVGYNYNVVTNAKNKVVDMRTQFKVKAIGASYNNGFGIQLDVAPSAVKTRKSDAANYTKRFGSGITTASPNGTEALVSDKATLIVFNQALQLTPNHTGQFYNTDPSNPKYISPVVYDTISFVPNTYTITQLGAQPFNPFIFIDKVRANEVHLPDYKPTTAADQSKFGTKDDASSVAKGKYYKSSKNMPFALHLLTEFQYPVEKASIVNTYLYFSAWAQSSGAQYKDWYSNTNWNYRNSSNVYSK